jgi:hypothetical protein
MSVLKYEFVDGDSDYRTTNVVPLISGGEEAFSPQENF